METIKSLISFLYYYPDGPDSGGSPHILIAIGLAYVLFPIWMNYEIAKKRGHHPKMPVVLAVFSTLMPVPFMAFITTFFLWIFMDHKKK